MSANRVPLVDDDDVVRMTLAGVLEHRGFEVTRATNVVEAVKRIDYWAGPREDYSKKTGVSRCVSDALFDWLLVVAPVILEQTVLKRPIPPAPQPTTAILTSRERS
jgi:CheY-like chemotaxis protein